MTEKLNPNGLPATRKKYTPALNAECVRQVTAGARPTDVVRAQGTSPALLSRWQRRALAQAVPSSAERDEIRRLRAELKRVEQARAILKRIVALFAQPPQSWAATPLSEPASGRGLCTCAAACWR